MATTPAAIRTVRVRIEGRVQGVGYRYWTQCVAGEFDLSGWVRNRRDGSVEAVFSGDPDAVAEMLDRCRQGPPASKVTRLDTEDETMPPPTGFVVKPTA